MAMPTFSLIKNSARELFNQHYKGCPLQPSSKIVLYKLNAKRKMLKGKITMKTKSSLSRSEKMNKIKT